MNTIIKMVGLNENNVFLNLIKVTIVKVISIGGNEVIFVKPVMVKQNKRSKKFMLE